MPPEDPPGPLQLCVDRLGASLELAAAMLLSAAGEEPLVAVDETAAVVIASGGLIEDRSGLRLHPWLAGFLRGEVVLSDDVDDLVLPVPRLAGERAERIQRVLIARSWFVEVVAPATSLAPAYVALAVENAGYVPLALGLADVSAMTLEPLLSEVMLQARMLSFVPILLAGEEFRQERSVMSLLQRQGWPVVLVVPRRTRAFTPRGPFATIELPEDDASARLAAWEELVPECDDPEVLGLIAHLPLSIAQMVEAHERWLSEAAAAPQPPGTAALQRHAMGVLMHHSSRLATRREVLTDSGDVVLPPPLRADVAELTAAARAMLDRSPAERQGLRALFIGASGTGKSATAQTLGGVLGVPVLFVDVSRVVDKYIGETEKNLDRLLAEAEASNALLIFDEGESLFGARSASSDNAGTEAMNRQISYLLARLEQHRGIVLVSSNYPGAIDKAFTRRFHFTLSFTAPTRQERGAVWASLLRRHGLDHLSSALDLDALADYELTGGNIAGICYIASLLLGDSAESSQDLLVRLCRREYARLGKRHTG